MDYDRSDEAGGDGGLLLTAEHKPLDDRVVRQGQHIIAGEGADGDFDGVDGLS